MALELLSISFNHDTSAATTDALNIRKNWSEEVVRPEWRLGETTLPVQSCAAYASRAPADRGRPFTIKAQFRRTLDMPSTLRVRARDPRPVEPVPTGCGALAAWLVLGTLTSLFRSINVLGDVAESEVAFLDGVTESDEVSFDLPLASVDRAGIRVDDITWQWEYREPNGDWTSFGQLTHHRIYCLLGIPNAPWSQRYEWEAGIVSPVLPWTEVLDYSCSWATLSGDVNTATERVTSSVYSLGPYSIEYDCPNHGRPHYTADYGYGFRCTQFLARLGGDIGCGNFVNCADCAAIVTTFANVLGANLSSRRMHHPQWTGDEDPMDSSLAFKLNEIVAIGTRGWSSACGWGQFRYHQVARTNDDLVYDACLKVDGDEDPTRPPHLPLLPTHMPFEGHNQYRDRLAIPGEFGRERCILEDNISYRVYLLS